MWITYAVVSMTKNCFSAAMADIVAEGFLIKSQTELITSMFYVVYTPLQIVGGIVSDKFSPEKMVKIGLIGGGIANTSIYLFNIFSTDTSIVYPAMLISWIFNAAVQFSIWASIFKVVSSQCCRSDRPKMIFLISLSPSAGFILSYTIGALLPNWRLNFSISAIALFTLAIALHFYDKRINGYMRWDKVEEVIPKEEKIEKKNVSAFKLFLSSGFIVLLLAIFLRDAVGAIVRRIASTMLNDIFEVGPTIGNLMSTLIVVTSVIGIIVARLMLRFKLIKNQIIGIGMGMLISTLFAVFFIFAPDIASSNVLLSVVLMCLIAGITTATGLFSTTISSSFVKYGKNATAAGLCNAAVSLGYIAPLIAVLIEENSNWTVVRIVIAVAAALSTLITFLILPVYNRFNKKEANKEAQG